jgi:predicted phosphodiesterase
MLLHRCNALHEHRGAGDKPRESDRKGPVATEPQPRACYRAPPMRVLHFTDVHVPTPFNLIPWRELINKRLLGALNTRLRRRHKFAQASDKLRKLDDFRREQGIDLVLCTGDYTVLGSEAEYAVAKAAIAPLMQAPLGYLHVPGNHDLYLPDTVEQRRFERTFPDSLRSDLPEFSSEGGWPFVRLIGDEVAVVGVNSARPNPQVWRSSGRVPEGQVAVLPRILSDERVASRFVFVITHYGVRREDGTPDGALHGMENADELLLACSILRRGALLHGHIHHCYHLEVDGLHVFNAGSSTYAGREGVWIFDVNGQETEATRARYVEDRYVLDPAEVYRL